MATYSTNLALTLLTTGEGAGTWGDTTNTNLGTLLEQSISGYVTQAMTTGNTTTITIPNGATGVARNMFIEMTGTGGTNTVLQVPANKKLYFIYNNTTGAVTVKVSGQTGVSVAAGIKTILVSNGTDVVAATSFGTGTGTVTSVAADGSTTGLTFTGSPITTSGTLTLGGTLATTNGGTGLTSFTANKAVYATSTSALTTGTLPVAAGGTGLATTPTNGQLLIGNGTNYTLATISAGTGIAVTNSAGGITIAASGGGLPTMNIVTGTTQTATANNHYVLTNAAATTLTLPASPSAGDAVWVSVNNGLTTNVVARNGNKIQSIAEDMTINAQYGMVQLRYVNATIGWTFT